MKIIGTILTCNASGKRCPFNWDLVSESAGYEAYFRDNCPHERYEKRGNANLICKKAKAER